MKIHIVNYWHKNGREQGIQRDEIEEETVCRRLNVQSAGKYFR